MSGERKVVVVMPAFNAARTLEMTYKELPHQRVSLVILVDDGISDQTIEIAKIESENLHAKAKLRIRRESEDVLHRGTEGGGGYHRDGAP